MMIMHEKYWDIARKKHKELRGKEPLGSPPSTVWGNKEDLSEVYYVFAIPTDNGKLKFYDFHKMKGLDMSYDELMGEFERIAEDAGYGKPEFYDICFGNRGHNLLEARAFFKGEPYETFKINGIRSCKVKDDEYEVRVDALGHRRAGPRERSYVLEGLEGC